VKIEGREISEDADPLFIAEIGINHEGSLDHAKWLATMAVTAGARVIKHQTHVIADEMTDAAKMVKPGNTDASIWEVMERCALGEAEERKLKAHVESQKATFISTPFSRAAADRLERMNVSAYKIGSGECNNLPLVGHVAAFGKPMIVSTGMNGMESVSETVEVLQAAGVEFALLHCVNSYPQPYADTRLDCITEMREAFPSVPIGLSDHTPTIWTALAAVGLGACIIEKHVTDRTSRKGPDVPFSLTPAQIFELVTAIRAVKQARGGGKGMVASEEVTAKFAFSTVVTTASVKKHECLTDENLWVKRPGIGDYPAADYQDLLGAYATQDLPAGHHLMMGDIK
tara:strand:+ start:3947 stop:4975 length:1029 start_codon:yes stop_codon:yes gene_type:complete